MLADQRCTAADFTALFVGGENETKRFMAMFTVDHEIGIEGQHSILIVNFRHPYNTRVGERHWPISIFPTQLAKRGNVLINAERDPEGTIFKKLEQSILSSGKAGEQMHRFRQNRFTDEQRRLQFIDPFDDPGMMTFCSVDDSDQWPRINDGATHCGQKS
jgi:hypothetical protein